MIFNLLSINQEKRKEHLVLPNLIAIILLLNLVKKISDKQD